LSRLEREIWVEIKTGKKPIRAEKVKLCAVTSRLFAGEKRTATHKNRGKEVRRSQSLCNCSRVMMGSLVPTGVGD